MLIKQSIHHPNAHTPYVFFKDEFTPAECQAIINIAKTLRPENATTGTSENPGNDKSIRSSEVSWLQIPTVATAERKWIYDRLTNVCNKVREQWYPYHLSGFAEPVQLTHYKGSEGGHYEMHQDFGPNESGCRKLSLVMLLNDPSEFKGGELEIPAIHGPDKVVKEMAQGTVIAFPSFQLHRVLRITEGERWSLVCWIHGPQFV